MTFLAYLYPQYVIKLPAAHELDTQQGGGKKTIFGEEKKNQISKMKGKILLREKGGKQMVS